MGRAQEFQAQRWPSRGDPAEGRRSWQSERGLSRRAAQQPHPPVHDRPGSAAGAQGCGQGSQAQLRRPCKEAKLSYAGHVLMENRHGLAVNCCVTKATGRAEPEAALAMVEQIPGWRRITLGADTGYDRK